MPAFLSQNAGTVVKIPLHAATPVFAVAMGDLTLQKAIIRQGGITRSGLFQSQPTVGDATYFFVFGDGDDVIQITGFAFPSLCLKGGKPLSNADGLNEVLTLYDRNKIGSRSKPVIVSFGKRAFASFLVGMTVETAEPESMLARWSFTFRSFGSGLGVPPVDPPADAEAPANQNTGT